MYNPNPETWDCPKCNKNIARSVLGQIYSSGHRRRIIKFFCGSCNSHLRVRLDWDFLVRSMKVEYLEADNIWEE